MCTGMCITIQAPISILMAWVPRALQGGAAIGTAVGAVAGGAFLGGVGAAGGTLALPGGGTIGGAAAGLNAGAALGAIAGAAIGAAIGSTVEDLLLQMSSVGNVGDTEIEADWAKAQSDARLRNCPISDRCSWLEDQAKAGKYSPERIKRQAKKWGCRGSRFSKGGRPR